MSAMSELHADAMRLAQFLDDPTFSAPQAPPIGLQARIAFSDGHIWRRDSENGWATIDPVSPFDLLRLYRRDATADDWFAPFAAQLVRELEQAMREAGIINPDRKAA